MEQQTFLAVMRNLLVKLQIFLTRPQVMSQLVVIAAIVIVLGAAAALLTLLVQRYMLRSATSASEDQEESDLERPTLWRRLLFSVSLLVFPVLALLAANYAMIFMQARGQFVGLLDFLVGILWVLLVYRLLLALFYLLFNYPAVKRFQNRLFSPLFALFVIYAVLGLFLDINLLTNTILTDLSENPITFGALLFATVGLYFWVNGIWGINDIILAVARRSQSVNTGRLEASLALVAYVLIAAGIFVGLGQLGIDSTTFAAITAGLSVGLGFGLQSIIVNFISGILLLFEGTVRPDDFLIIDGKWACVKKLTIRATYVHDWKGQEKIVPNQKFITSNILNHTLSDDWFRLRVYITVRSQEDPMTIKALLAKFAQDDARVRGTPNVFLVNIDQGMKFQLRYWINIRLTYWDFMEDLYTFALREFGENNIQIAIPRQDVFLHGGSDAWQVLQPVDDTPLPPASLS